jgi:hypothetical protein
MILASNGILASSIASGPTYDADAQAFFDRVTTAGGTLSTTEKNATNQLVLDMKSAGIWSSMQAIYPMVGASAEACAQNLKSSSFTGTFTSGWTFASDGVTPNGTSAYFDTALNTNTLTNNSTHISYYSRSSTTGSTRCEIGGGEANVQILMLCFRSSGNYNGDQYYGPTATNRIDEPVANSQGFFVDSRTNTTTHKAFKSNTLIGTDTLVQIYDISSVSKNIYIGAFNNGGVANLFTDRQCALSSIGDGLTDTQASDFYTAVQAFQTALSRQV